MRVLARTQYALRAVLHLAAAAAPTATARDIADSQGTPTGSRGSSSPTSAEPAWYAAGAAAEAVTG